MEFPVTAERCVGAYPNCVPAIATICGEDPRHLTSLAVSESLCPRALAFAVRDRQQYIDREVNSAPKNANMAWSLFEQASATANPAEAKVLRDKADEHASLAFRDTYSSVQGKISAAVLELYKPEFLSRQQGASGPHNTAAIRQGLWMISDFIAAAPVHEPGLQHIIAAKSDNASHEPCFGTEGERLRAKMEIAFALLALRQDLFLYPVSPRETEGMTCTFYMLEDGVKIPIQLGRQPIDAIPELVVVNFNHFVKEVSEELRAAGIKLSGLVDQAFPGDFVLNLLGVEKSGQLQKKHKAFLDTMGRNLALRLVRSTHLPTRILAPDSSAMMQPWEISPKRTVRAEVDSSETHQAHDANLAARRYSRWQKRPLPAELTRLIDEMRDSDNFETLYTCVGAYFDLAEQVGPPYGPLLIDAGCALAKEMMERHRTDRGIEGAQWMYRAAIYSAYGEKYKKFLSGKPLTIQDERSLCTELIEIGRRISSEDGFLGSTSSALNLRGAMFELNIHLLNAYLNVQDGRIGLSMWPSLPPEDHSKHAGSQKEGWDVAICRGNRFLDRAAMRRLQLKGTSKDEPQVSNYAPDVTLISGGRHLLLWRSDEILSAILLVENTDPNDVAGIEARRRLNAIGQRFLERCAHSFKTD